MATKRFCDGCGEAEGEHQLQLVGTITPHEYCAKCAALANQYMERRNHAHERAVEKWLEKHNAVLGSMAGQIELFPDA
jgi:hypothetical protein